MTISSLPLFFTRACTHYAKFPPPQSRLRQLLLPCTGKISLSGLFQTTLACGRQCLPLKWIPQKALSRRFGCILASDRKCPLQLSKCRFQSHRLLCFAAPLPEPCRLKREHHLKCRMQQRLYVRQSAKSSQQTPAQSMNLQLFCLPLAKHRLCRPFQWLLSPALLFFWHIQPAIISRQG